MMQLQDPKQTKVLIVTLAETTPCWKRPTCRRPAPRRHRAVGLGRQQQRGGRHPHSPLLRQRARNELREIDAVATRTRSVTPSCRCLRRSRWAWNACGLWRTGGHEPCCLTMGVFERYLTLWVALCILAGLALGNLMPELFSALAAIEYASVNLIVAVLIWAMVYPMMIAIDLGSLKAVGRRPRAGDHADDQLADQALHHGGAGGAVL
jgi:hypothetical protein